MEEDSNQSTNTNQSTESTTTTDVKQENPTETTTETTVVATTTTTTTTTASPSSSSSKSHSTHHTRRKKDSEVGKRECKLNPIYADFALDSRTMKAMTANRKRTTRSSTTSTTKSSSSTTSAPAKKKKKTSTSEAKPTTTTEDKKTSSSSKRSHRKSESSKKQKGDLEKDNHSDNDNDNNDNEDDDFEEPSTPDQIEPMSPLSSSPSSSSSHQHTKSTRSSSSTKKDSKLLTPKKEEEEEEGDENENDNGNNDDDNDNDVTMKVKNEDDDDNDEDNNDNEEHKEEGTAEIEESTDSIQTATLSSQSPSPSSSQQQQQQQIKQEKDNQPKQKSKSKSKKKGSIDPDSPEWIKAIYSFIKALMKLPEAGPFLDPVDPVALCIPDYFDVIKEPMDLGTIRQKIEASSRKRPSPEGAEEGTDAKLYNNLDDVSNDIRLVFSNAKTYNPPGHNVHDYAAALGNVFERRLSKIEMIARNPEMSNGASEYKWLHLEVRRAIEEQTRKIREMKHAEELRQQQIEHQQKLNLRRIADGILTSEQKRLLVEKISKQKGRELAKVVDVLKTYSVALRQSFALAQQNSEFVVEVDLERLPNPVLTLLWRLMFPNDSTFSPMTPSSPALASSPGMDQKKKKKQSQPHSSLQQSVEFEQNEDFQDFTLEKDKNT